MKNYLFYLFVFLFYINSNTYDYIIVGGGTAGGTLAVKLAEKGYYVLLIEAGPNLKNLSENITIPGLHPRATEDPKIVLNYMIDRGITANEESKVYPRSSALGGCSLMNAMISVYPNKRDFDIMVSKTDDESWSEMEMRKYFKRMNQWYPIKYQKYDKSLFKNQEISQLIDQILPELNSTDINEYSNGILNVDLEGNKFVPSNINHMSERGNLNRHINLASEKFNLEIWDNTLVTNVILKKQQIPTAIGVEYIKGNNLYGKHKTYPNNGCALKKAVYARNEVILSAGVFNTPQLLMLSGIGQNSSLSKLGIELVHELRNVGKNLQDRYEVPIVIEYPQRINISNGCSVSTKITDSCYNLYKLNSSGPYADNGIFSIQYTKSRKNLTEPDIYILNLLGEFLGYRPGWAEDYSHSFNKFTQLIIKARTKNKEGYVSLKSSDPFEMPYINFNFYKDGNYDLNIITKQIKVQRDLLKKLNLRISSPNESLQSDEEIRNYILNYSWGHHACCTAKMGIDKSNDVVDNNFKVHGIKNLRVVDASIFPEIPGYFPTVYIHMIAMKAADVIDREASSAYTVYNSFLSFSITKCMIMIDLIYLINI